ncbi:cuticle protein 38 isoform X2 [Folsomia candida]|uniref:cuticle protein 38 isoform X2 n=1 Tax=Folsomia candida TaxID=158441 RepID=UPI0016050748|nr:cuticle protein 38 isoform X2 [Folsomia candida]
MNSIVALLAFVAVANAGFLAQPAVYQSAVAVPAAQSLQYNNRAPAARLAVAAAPVAYAAPAYAAPVATYAHAAPVAYAHAPVVAKAIVPAAQSYSFNQRAPAAKIAVAAPVAYAAAAPAVATFAHQTFSTPYANYAW